MLPRDTTPPVTEIPLSAWMPFVAPEVTVRPPELIDMPPPVTAIPPPLTDTPPLVTAIPPLLTETPPLKATFDVKLDAPYMLIGPLKVCAAAAYTRFVAAVSEIEPPVPTVVICAPVLPAVR